VALAGGGAMLAHEFVDRPTNDIDLFTPEAGEVGTVTDALREALHGLGYTVELTRREDRFSRLQVTAADGRQIEVELAQDARMLPAVELAVGAVLHPDELAADKTLALFGRAEARDLVDVNALAGRYSRERLLELAATKDPGFDTAVFADALGVAAASSAQAFADLGVDEPDSARLRDYATDWRSELTTAPDPDVPGDPTTPDDPAATPALEKENPVTRPASLDDVLAVLDAQEAAVAAWRNASAGWRRPQAGPPPAST